MSLCVKELSSGSTADEIYNCVLQALDEPDLDINKLCALAIDGASVMTGYTGPHWDVSKKTFKFLQPHVTEKKER